MRNGPKRTGKIHEVEKKHFTWSQISDFRFRFQDGPATGNTLALSVEYQSIIQIASMAQSRLGMHSKNRKDGGLHDASRGMTSAD